MSLFLGKIHYWLFDKILWFEGLEDEIIKLAQREGLNIDEITKEINLKYGAKIENKNLEEIIDTNNIHGWLQDKIHSSEGRMASWTKFMLENNKDNLAKLENVYTHQGIKAGKDVKVNKSLLNAIDIYNSLNDYILDGMPCDRVNEVVVSQEDMLEWKRRICVHKEIWEKEGIDVQIFYNLRNLWIKAFVDEVNSDFEYIQKSETEYCISKRK